MQDKKIPQCISVFAKISTILFDVNHKNLYQPIYQLFNELTTNITKTDRYSL